MGRSVVPLRSEFCWKVSRLVVMAFIVVLLLLVLLLFLLLLLPLIMAVKRRQAPGEFGVHEVGVVLLRLILHFDGRVCVASSTHVLLCGFLRRFYWVVIRIQLLFSGNRIQWLTVKYVTLRRTSLPNPELICQQWWNEVYWDSNHHCISGNDIEDDKVLKRIYFQYKAIWTDSLQNFKIYIYVTRLSMYTYIQ